MKKLLALLLVLGLALGQNIFSELPPITPTAADAPGPKITKLQPAGLAWMLPHLEKYAKFLHSKPTARCAALDAYTMTGGWYQIEAAYGQLEGLALKPNEANNPVYAVFSTIKGNRRYVVAFFLGAVAENPTKLLTVARCLLE